MIFTIHYSWIIMSKFNGSLDTLLTENVLKNLKIGDILWQIAFGLNHLHEQNIVHGRLKPSNVLVQETNMNEIVFNLSDYGYDKLGVANREVRYISR